MASTSDSTFFSGGCSSHFEINTGSSLTVKTVLLAQKRCLDADKYPMVPVSGQHIDYTEPGRNPIHRP